MKQAVTLTAEERRRIYLEEKARFEVRRELEGKETSAGKIIGWILLSGLGLLIAMIIFGTIIGDNEKSKSDAAWRKLTPAQQDQKASEACGDFLVSVRFKTYSELSIEERKMKASCGQ
jgi:hypothetical protein